MCYKFQLECGTISKVCYIFIFKGRTTSIGMLFYLLVCINNNTTNFLKWCTIDDHLTSVLIDKNTLAITPYAPRGYLHNLDSGFCTGPWTYSYSGSDQLVSLYHYCLANLHSFLIQDAPHLRNYICDKCLMKSFHGAHADDDLDQFI